MRFRSLHRHNQTFIRCRDAHGRARDLGVAYDEHGNVTLTMAPGETIVLDASQAGQVRSLMQHARIAAAAFRGPVRV
jgi:hypothetical protein